MDSAEDEVFTAWIDATFTSKKQMVNISVDGETMPSLKVPKKASSFVLVVPDDLVPTALRNKSQKPCALSDPSISLLISCIIGTKSVLYPSLRQVKNRS